MSMESARLRIRRTHPALWLAALDTVGLVVALYLSVVELQNEIPVCGPLHGCETVATSPYSRLFGVPVAVFGVILSITLLTLALAWWRRGTTSLLLAHYALSLVGVLFEIRFIYIQAFVIHAVCMWCAIYGISLIARFVIALWIWTHREQYEGVTA